MVENCCTTCPCCGYCPTCGRWVGPFPMPVYPPPVIFVPVPYPQPMPYYPIYPPVVWMGVTNQW
jgi:hypothetical protein